MKESSLDKSETFDVFFAVELPFWISIESGKYFLPNNRELNLRNDLWLLIMGNIIDDSDDLGFAILNETQIDNMDLISRLVKPSLHYHKRKLKTTFTRPIQIIPKKGAITAHPGTKEWVEQLERVLMSVITLSDHQQLLDDINSFLDYYISIISPAFSFGEVRRVSFYDVMFRVIITKEYEGKLYVHSLNQTPDIRMADIPYPSFKVKVKGQSQKFHDALQSNKQPAFHQLQWAKTLNHMREGRFQEALLSCAIVLEALSYRYWSGLKKWKLGLPKWLETQNYPKLKKTLDDAANLYRLRNKVVHRQRVLTNGDTEKIKSGISALGKLRHFFLQKLNPEILTLEKEFSSFLEPTYLIAARASVGKSVPIAIEWRREIDRYEKLAR